MKKVLFVYKFLPQYRINFFNQLRDDLYDCDIELQLIYGNSNAKNVLKGDEVNIGWAKFIPNKRFFLGKTEIIWQPCIRELKDKDLIIVQNESKLLLNYYLMSARRFSKYKLGFWNHVYNRQDDLNSLRNRFKLIFLHRCDWWFGYTSSAKKYLIEKNFPSNKITTVQNAIDTQTLQKWYIDTGNNDIERLIDRLGIRNAKTALFCGSMYPDKRIDFILSSCRKIKESIPEFHMIFIGAGEDSIKVIEASRRWNWIHYIGPKFGQERIKYFKVSMVQLMPFAVGLAILDSFAMETPIITTDNQFHGPEIEYLENEVNGYLTTNSIDDFSKKAIEVLRTNHYNKLLDCCKTSAKKYSVEAMVENFKTGIISSIYG